MRKEYIEIKRTYRFIRDRLREKYPQCEIKIRFRYRKSKEVRIIFIVYNRNIGITMHLETCIFFFQYRLVKKENEMPIFIEGFVSYLADRLRRGFLKEGLDILKNGV